MVRSGSYIVALATVALTLGLIGALRTRFDLPTAALLYLVPIILAATRYGRGPAVAAAVASAVGHDFFFLAQVGSLRIANLDEAIGLALLLFTALATAQLAEGARRAAEQEHNAAVARRSNEHKTTLLRAVAMTYGRPWHRLKPMCRGCANMRSLTLMTIAPNCSRPLRTKPTASTVWWRTCWKPRGSKQVCSRCTSNRARPGRTGSGGCGALRSVARRAQGRGDHSG